MVAARLLRKETGCPVLELTGDAAIVQLSSQPFHGHDAKHIGDPRARRRVDFGGLTEQARDILAGNGFLQNAKTRNRAALVQGKRRKIEGRSAVLRQAEKMQEDGFERVGVRALDHLAVQILA